MFPNYNGVQAVQWCRLRSLVQTSVGSGNTATFLHNYLGTHRSCSLPTLPYINAALCLIALRTFTSSTGF